MTLSELHEILQTTGYPVAYFDFSNTPLEERPQPPYIAYRVLSAETDGGDYNHYLLGNNISVELYTKSKDLVAERKLDKLLKFAECGKYESRIENGFFMVRYTFGIVENILEEE